MHPNNPRDPRDWLVVLEWEAGSDPVAGAEAVRQHLEAELGELADEMVLAGELTWRRVALPG